MNHRMRSLHRTMGAAVSLFVLILAITGILLNNTSVFKLDQRYVTWHWLLSHYGIATVKPDTVYLLDNKVISQFDQQIFVDAHPVTRVNHPLLGGVSLDDMIILATSDGLILLTPEGGFIEYMSAAAGIPAMIQNIGLFHGDPVLQTREGQWRSDFMLDQWESVSLHGVGWSIPQPMPESVSKDLATYFHGRGISIERLVLDIHNGTILNKAGVWLLDLLGGLLVFLSLTGLWLWARGWR